MADAVIPAPATPRLGAWRLAAGVALIAAAIGILVQQVAFRTAEAHLIASAIQQFTLGRTAAAGAIVYFGIGTSDVQGIIITPLCSSVILAAPLCALGGILMMLPAFRALRVITGLACGLALALSCNAARYVASAWALQTWGRGGFNLVHEYLGSLLVIFGFAAAIFLTVRISARHRRRAPRHA